MAEIRWTNEAVQWLQRIHKYVSEEDPDAAQRIVQGIYEKAQVLKSFPEIGRHYRDESGATIRIILYEEYRIAYLVKAESIDILGVYHGAMDLERYFDP